MTMEDFVLLLDEHFDGIRGQVPIGQFAFAYGSQKRAFKTISDYRWALNELEQYVEDEVGATYEPQAIYKFVDAVVGFEYQMDVYSHVNLKHRLLFENARVIAEEVEDILNAMM